MKRIFMILTVAAMTVSPVLAKGADDGLKIKCNGGSISFDGKFEINGDNGERVAIDGNTVVVRNDCGEEVHLDFERLDFTGGECKYSATVIDKDGKVVKTVKEDGTTLYPDSGKPSKAGKVVMKAFKSNMDFDKIDVSRSVKLIVEERTDGNIIVRANEKMMPYLEVSVAKGVLKAKISNKIKSLNMPDGTVAEVYIPNNGRIRSIEASAASSVNVKPVLNVAGELDIEASGASRINIKANAGKTDIECSGASKIVADITTGGDCEIDVSGASKLELSGSARKGSADVSGAAKMNASDMKFESLSIDVSGASSANISATKCVVDVSGASKADVYCDGVLSAEASGASSIRYSGDCTTHLSGSGISSIKKK